MPTVLCTALNTETGPHVQILQQAGFCVRHAPRDRNLYDPGVLIEVARGVDAVLAGSEPWTRVVMEALPSLRVLSRTGVGYDAIDLRAADDLQIVVAITPGVNHHAVAEHTLAMLMAVARGFPDRDRQVREGRWERISTPRIMGSTLGIVGLGRIGQAVATRAAGLGLHLLAHDPQAPADFAQQWQIELVSLDRLLAESDYISLHCPLTPESRHMINMHTLSRIKSGAVLINTARGALVDEAALYEALKTRRLRAAALDVFEEEPLSLKSPLLTLDNVLLSGHVAGLDDQSLHDTLTMAADTIVRLYRGEWPSERLCNMKQPQIWKWDKVRSR